MSDYSHLSTPIADTRYLLAAHYLDVADNVVEVGGHRIGHFLPEHHPRDRNTRHIWCIDPSAPEPKHWEKHRVYPMPATAFNFNVLEEHRGRKGLCLLGLEMYDEEYGVGSGMLSCERIAENLHHFDTVVIEFVVENPVAKTQALILLGAAVYGCDMTRTIQFTTQWVSDSKYPEPNESFSKTREFWVLEKS